MGLQVLTENKSDSVLLHKRELKARSFARVFMAVGFDDGQGQHLNPLRKRVSEIQNGFGDECSLVRFKWWEKCKPQIRQKTCQCSGNNSWERGGN